MPGQARQIQPSWLGVAPYAFICLWGTGYPVAKLALDYTQPFTLLALRFGCTLLVLTPLVLVLRPSWPDKRSLAALASIALFLQITHFGLVYLGLHLGASASIMGLFAASQPVLINLASALSHRRMPAARVWLGLGLGLVGAAWIMLARGEVQSGALLGALLGFGAVIGVSIGVTIENRHKPICHPLLGFWIQYALASLVAVPLAFAFGPPSLVLAPKLVGSLVYLVFCNALLGIYLLLSIMRHGQVSRVSAIMFLVPAVAALASWMLLGETLPPAAWPGIALAALGVLLVLYAPKTRTAT